MRARRHLRTIAFAIALGPVLAAGTAGADSMTHVLEFSERDLTLFSQDGYGVALLAGCDLTDEPGSPQLPVRATTLLLPLGARVEGVEVVSAASTELVPAALPRPAQHPRILPIPGLDPPARRIVGPDPAVYGSVAPYPATIVELLGSGRAAGSETAELAVYPLQYLPDRHRLRFFNRIELRVDYTPGDEPKLLPGGRELSRVAAAAAANRRPPAPARPMIDGRVPDLLDPEDHEYVLITAEVLSDEFEPLVAWKTRKGVPAKLVTVEWIDSVYAGDDGAERIRSFIQDAYATWGTTWVLLGGDPTRVPYRPAYAMTCEAGMMANEDHIPCDLYYSDLDGSWDADGDGTYGETTDGVDLHPDVFVGRASVLMEYEAEAFVAKTLAYERTPEPAFALDMLMAGEILWSDPYTDSGVGLNMIDRDCVPPRYDPITKLYESLGNETNGTVIAALNEGKGHFLHDGHAWYSCMGCGVGYIYDYNVEALTNGSELPLVYSIGCWPAAFDYFCIAEDFLANPDGGAVAFIGNSRYGWGSPGNPGYGYSDRFMHLFYHMLFVEEIKRAGPALAAAKEALIPFSRAENVYRWHQYQVNLLGDPEMYVWTDEPATLAIAHPDSVPEGTTPFTVSVRTARGPTEGALVCLANGSDVYERGRTGADGMLTLTVETSVPDSIAITVTAADCRPYETRIPATVSGAFLRPVASTVDDASGNGDRLAGPGETLDLSVTLLNCGGTAATAVEATLSTDDPDVTVLTATSSFGDIPSGEEKTCATPYSLLIDGACPDRHAVLLDVTMTDGARTDIWTGVVSLTVAAPVLGVGSYAVDDVPSGDGDGVPEPGEELTLMVEIDNEGLAAAASPSMTLWTTDPYVDVTAGSVTLPSVAASASGHAVFEIAVDPSCATPYFPDLYLDATTDDGFHAADTLTISIGTVGFEHAFEAGAPGWTHAGASDLWHLTTNRAHSGTTAWYAGTEDTWQYGDAMDCHLDSPEFAVGVDTEVSFWCWYEVTIYGVDGLYVELVRDGAVVDTLDFIGSGGALGSLDGIGNDWLEYSYDLDAAPGDTLSLRFRFASDGSDVAEGVYVDDVAVRTTVIPSETGVGESVPDHVPSVRLHQNCPNPFSPSTSVRFTMQQGASVHLAVYNIQGRLIRTLVDAYKAPGDHVVLWDGKDDLGTDVAAGVYLYRVAVGEFEEARKMILVR